MTSLFKRLFSNKLFFFVFFTYLFFLILFLITGVVTTFITKSNVVMNILKTICAWSSFFVLMIFFKRFYPDTTRRAFFKNLFKDKINILVILGIIVFQGVVFILSLWAVSLYKHIEISSMVEGSIPTLILLFFTNLISGPIGEEPGWRGFFLTEIIKKKGILKGSLINGLLWGFWHIPLWIIMGYGPTQLLIYAIVFVSSITATNVIMGYLFTKKRNIIYCVLLHQLVNYLFGAVYILNRLDIFIPFAIIQVTSTIIFVLVIELIPRWRKNK